MASTTPHSWLFPSSIEEAKEAQRQMAEEVSLVDDLSPIHSIGGLDVSNNPYDPHKMVYAAATLLSYPDLTRLGEAGVAERQSFPYISGFLGFREVPVLLQAIEKLPFLPDLFMIDGQGISHPRGLGIASHLGVILKRPTIGVAKSILVGHPAAPLDVELGSTTPLLWKGKTIGMLLRSKKRCNPLIISPGYRISLERAVDIVKQTLRGYRLPEPTRSAHQTANVYRTQGTSIPAKQYPSAYDLIV